MKLKFIERIKRLFTHQDLLDTGDEDYFDVSSHASISNQASNQTTTPVSPKTVTPQPLKAEDLEIDKYMVDTMAAQTPTALHSSISTKQSYLLSHLFDMAYVASSADTAIYLPRPFKAAHTPGTSQKYENIYRQNVKISDKNFEANKKTNKTLTMRMDSQMQFFGRVREIYPDFGLNFQEKISPEDYETYMAGKKNLKKVLFKSYPFSGDSDLGEYLENARNDISKVIDSKEFSRACQIEDSFILSELGVFFDKFAELPPEKQSEFKKAKIQKSKNSKPVGILDFANRLKSEKEKKLEQYEAIEKLYTKLENHSYINLVVPETPEEQQSVDDDAR